MPLLDMSRRCMSDKLAPTHVIYAFLNMSMKSLSDKCVMGVFQPNSFKPTLQLLDMSRGCMSDQFAPSHVIHAFLDMSITYTSDKCVGLMITSAPILSTTKEPTMSSTAHRRAMKRMNQQLTAAMEDRDFAVSRSVAAENELRLLRHELSSTIRLLGVVFNSDLEIGPQNLDIGVENIAPRLIVYAIEHDIFDVENLGTLHHAGHDETIIYDTCILILEETKLPWHNIPFGLQTNEKFVRKVLSLNPHVDMHIAMEAVGSVDSVNNDPDVWLDLIDIWSGSDDVGSLLREVPAVVLRNEAVWKSILQLHLEGYTMESLMTKQLEYVEDNSLLTNVDELD